MTASPSTSCGAGVRTTSPRATSRTICRVGSGAWTSRANGACWTAIRRQTPISGSPTRCSKPEDFGRATPTPRRRDRSGYWAANLRLIIGLLIIWLGVTFLPILFINQLNQIELSTGLPLGYFMGAQGSPIAFVILIAFYVWRMERLDQAYGGD